VKFNLGQLVDEANEEYDRNHSTTRIGFNPVISKFNQQKLIILAEKFRAYRLKLELDKE
jgi:hypothetical protein